MDEGKVCTASIGGCCQPWRRKKIGVWMADIVLAPIATFHSRFALGSRMDSSPWVVCLNSSRTDGWMHPRVPLLPSTFPSFLRQPSVLSFIFQPRRLASYTSIVISFIPRGHERGSTTACSSIHVGLPLVGLGLHGGSIDGLSHGVRTASDTTHVVQRRGINVVQKDGVAKVDPTQHMRPWKEDGADVDGWKRKPPRVLRSDAQTDPSGSHGLEDTWIGGRSTAT